MEVDVWRVSRRTFRRLNRIWSPIAKTSNGSRKTAKSFSLFTMNISRKKKAKFPKIEVALESCYPESSSSCDRKSVYIKRNVKLYTPKERVPKTEKRTSARISKNLKTTKTVRTLKLISSKKVPKNVVAEISERDFMKNWFPDSSSSNSNDYNSGCTDCGEIITTKKKKLKHRSERTRASTSTRLSELLRNIGTSSVIEESVKNKEDSKQTAEIFSKNQQTTTTTRAPSVTRRAAVTSLEKSTCPGESIRLIKKPFSSLSR
ncbi:uncharacterized protein [Temnothorax longispinosus]|uniref:uncharacterized protein isoform X4 n=1 Tax=Temnothorax longispinosus TaxID=300112 RepID=UPI003A9939CD